MKYFTFIVDVTISTNWSLKHFVMRDISI